MSELTQIKPIVANEAELKQLAQDYGNLVVTTENVDAADKARLRLKNERITIQRQEKANNDVLKQIKKDNEGRAELLIGIIKPVEDKLDLAITAIKEAEAKKKEQARLKEQNRVQGHRNRITGIAQSTARLALANNIEDIRVKVAEIEAMSGTFEEFEVEADEAIQLFKMSAGNRVEQLQRIEAEKKAEEAQQKLELEENVPPLTFKEIGQEMVNILDESRTAEPVIVTTVKDDSQVEVTRPNGNHTVNDGISNVDKDVVVDNMIPMSQMRFSNNQQPTQVPINYSTMGYDFHIPVTIPQQYQDKIKSAIEAVLGEMPLNVTTG